MDKYDQLLTLSKEWNAYMDGMPDKVDQGEAYRHITFQQALIFKAILIANDIRPVE